MKITPAMHTQIKHMIDNKWYASLHIDDLPVYYFIGEMEENILPPGSPESDVMLSTHYLWTVRDITMKYNGNQIVSISIVNSGRVPLETDLSISLSYSVQWRITTDTFSDRHSRYRGPDFFDNTVHRLSVIHSCVVCFLLCCGVVVILRRTLKRDIARYEITEDEGLESLDRADESGWKQVSGDVFRRPPHLLPLSVILAWGVLVVCATTLVLVCALSTNMSMSELIDFLLYSVCGSHCVAGCVGGGVYKCFCGIAWKRAMIVQATSPVIASVLCSVCVGIVATHHGSTLTLSPGVVIQLSLVWVVVCVPLYVIGTLIGRRLVSRHNFPCRVRTLRRPIPPQSPYLVPGIIAVSGAVPFGSLYMELYFVFASLWSFRLYSLAPLLLLVLCILLLVVACTSVSLVFLLLNQEDYRWAWVVTTGGMSTGLMFFCFCLKYFIYNTWMSGTLQVLYYFAFSVLSSCCLGTACASISFFASFLFVRTIFSNVKSD
eukprot:GHVR01009007.1.p1 GENE.GHVR01009007.1~~GHVR01009007.1.p1  ORF type:complete len:490 (+),score=68.59 GHVR01009007.1:389-1858(+)